MGEVIPYRFVVMLQEFTSNELGRGTLLLALGFFVQWPQYYLGGLLKAYAPRVLHPKIPAVLLLVGMVLSALALSPLGRFLTDVTYAELMLVASMGTAGAKKIHDDKRQNGK